MWPQVESGRAIATTLEYIRDDENGEVRGWWCRMNSQKSEDRTPWQFFLTQVEAWEYLRDTYDAEVPAFY